MTTLKDIAKIADVSVMTVSRVVNGNTTKVSQRTRERILKIIEETGYVPNYSARALINQRSNIIPIIMKSETSPEDPYNAKMLGKIIPTLQKNGYFAMVVSLSHFDEINHHLQAWNAAGAIFLGLFDEDINEIKDMINIPIVFTDSYIQHSKYHTVRVDDYTGGCIAAKHYLDMGHRKLSVLGFSLGISPVTTNRCKGFTDTLAKYNIILNKDVIMSDLPLNDVIKKLTRNKITGIFATADVLALDVLKTLHEHNIVVPDQISIIGFDGLELTSYVTPKITTVSQHIDTKAEYVSELLLNSITQKETPSTQTPLNVSLIKGASVKSLI